MIEVGIDLLDHGVVYGLQYLLLWIFGWSELFYIAHHSAFRRGLPSATLDGQSASLGHSSSRGTSGRLLSIGLIFLTLASTALATFREVSESDGTVAKVIETISLMLVCFLQICTVGRNVDHVYLFSFWTLRLLALSMDVLEYWKSYDLLHTGFAAVWLVLCFVKSQQTPAQPSRTEPNLIRQLYFSWLDPLYREAHSGSASFYDGKLFDRLQDDRRCDALLEWFRHPKNGGAYTAVGKAEDRLLTIGKLLAPFRWDIVCTGLNRFVSVSFYFLCSYLLRVLLEENQSQMVQKWIVTGLFATSIMIAVLNTQYQHATRDIGLRLQSLLMGTVYENMLQEVPPLASSATLTTDTGTFVSLMQNLHMMWSGPLIILVTFGALWWIIGWISAVVGFLIMGLTIWGSMILAKKLNVQQISIKRAMDARVKLTTDSIEQIQQIKSDQLEEVMERRIGEHRGQELGHMRASIWYEATKYLVGIVTPMVVAYGTFLFMELIGSGSLLTVQSMFVAISLFNITRYPMSVMPTLFTSWNDTKLSLQRINVFIQTGNKELEQPTLPAAQPQSSSSGLNGGAQKRIRQVSEELSNILVDQNHWQPEVVQIDRGQFSIKDKVVLHDISLKLRRGTFTAVYGTHASGKSSLLRAIIGSLRKTSGTMNVPVETMSYCQQTPWIHSGTVRSNILFGDVFDPARYEQVIRACCLEEDFTLFTGGDQRVIGDGGHSLSGGQAARVSLARAVYKKAQLYLFDDPLKSLDHNVSRKVFEEVFNRSSGLLAECTCVFVSHNLEHLQVADSVVIMREGTIEDILNSSQTIERYGSVIPPGDSSVDEEKGPQEKKVTKNGTPFPMRNRKSNPKFQSEPSHQGSVPLRLYVDFGRMLGWFYCMLIVALESIVTGLDIYITILLAQQKETGLLFTGVIVIGWTICLFLKTELLHFRGLSLAKTTHANMLATILRQPMAFFDQNDSGVVVNRFSHDLNVLDAKIVPSVRNVLTSCFAVLGTLVLFACKLSSVYLLFVMAAVGVGCAFALLFGLSRLLSYHLRVARTLKRLESSSRSPIVLQYNETVQGIDTIKSFGAEKRFFRQFLERVDQHQNYVYHNLAAQRWIGVRLEFIGAIVIYYVALLTVIHRSLVGLTFVAIIVSYVLRLIPSLNGLLLASGLLEENIISFERVSQYLNLSQEYPDDGGVAYPTNNANGKPSRGPIEFRDFSLAHADGSTVLHNLTLTIGAGEKLGIIGRTGAGKSSFVGTLFRFYPKHTSGYILIDGVDVAKISLKSLRRSIALVPQSTTLLSGRVQDFVDPHNAHPIERLTSTLRLCELGNVTLDAALEELSVGQRQLLCMVRGLLYNRPIIVLDEATSALDDGMERQIQRLVREHFHDRTVLMIAHRLNTVKSCDRILWLQDGRIHKLAPPSDFSAEDWNVLKHGE